MISFLGSVLVAAAADCDSQRQLKLDNKPSSHVFSVDTSVVLTEEDSDVEYSLDGLSWLPIALPATRKGSHIEFIGRRNNIIWLKTSIVPVGTVQVRTYCSNSPFDDHVWWNRLQKLSERHDYTVSLVAADPAELNTLRREAVSDVQKAFVTHVIANQAFLRSQLSEAETEFGKASTLWTKLDNESLLIASVLGEAELALARANYSRTNAIIDSNQPIISKLSEKSYFGIRFADLRCRQRVNLGDWADFLQCQLPIINAYRNLGEVTEEVNSSVNLIYTLPIEKRLTAISAVGDRIAQVPITPYFRLYRGRFNLLASNVHRDSGFFAESLNFNRLAIIDFELASQERERWLVSAYIQSASLQMQLGLHDQSFAILSKAFEFLNARDEPSRAATLIHQLGAAYEAADMRVQAVRWYENAAKLRRLLDLKAHYAASLLLRFEVEPPDDLAALDDLKALSLKDGNRVQLLRARILLNAGLLNQANNLLANISLSTLSQPERDSLALLQAGHARAQNSQAGDLILTNRLDALAKTADQAPTAALAYLTLRSGAKVRRAWVDALTPFAEPESVFRTALLATPARFMTSVTTIQKRMETAAKQPAGEVGFLAQLTGPQAAAPERFKAANVPTLAAFQARLPKGGLALLLLPGDQQSAALWVSQDRAWVILLPSRSQLMAEALSLSRALGSPLSVPKAAQDAARMLASSLFSGMQHQPAPSSLWIVADELSAAIAFSALYWPGGTEPLVAGTDVSLITGLRVDPGPFGQPTPAVSPIITAFFAPDYSRVGAAANPTELKILEFAGIERARIEQETGKNWQAIIGKDATRATFQDLIQTPGLMLHVAAHGRADPGVLGNAGLWLTNDVGPDADFLSWLELGNMRTQAELLVLNACQSATGAQPSRQANISFALAMSASGASHVIAALWPVSDVASNTWIPAFYKQLALGQSAGDLGGAHSAAALRQAQLSLYQSPHYRHPFYWASLVHFQRVVF